MTERTPPRVSHRERTFPHVDTPPPPAPRAARRRTLRDRGEGAGPPRLDAPAPQVPGAPPVATAAPVATVPPPPPPIGHARIIDRGYRRYSGPRTGTRGALRTVWIQAMQRALGLRRSAWAKILPFGAILISYVPAIVFVGVVALVPDEDLVGLELPTYGQYFTFIQAAVALFVAFVAPEVLCPDRRTGMLGIYLASPLDRDSYLLAKAAAVATILAAVTIGPPLLMLIAFIIQGSGPDGPVAVLQTLGRIVAAGGLITILYTTVSMAVASLTDRKAVATAGMLLLTLVSSTAIGVVVAALNVSEGLFSLDLFLGPFVLVQLIHGEVPELGDVSLALSLAATAGWSALGVMVCRTRYHGLQVTR